MQSNLCGNPMKCKLKALFIGITISILIGNIVPNVFLTPETETTAFGTWTEAAHPYYDAPELEEDFYLEYSIPSQGNWASTARHSSKNKRIHPTANTKSGVSCLKGKEHKDYYTSPIYSLSIRRFSSGCNEGRLQLISFGRLVI